MPTHFIPIDFNQDSICGLQKTQWDCGTNNWEWVSCSACLERRPTQDALDTPSAVSKDGTPAKIGVPVI